MCYLIPYLARLGKASASILANNAEELEKLNKKVQESYKGQGYVQELAQKNQGTVKKQMAQFKEASEAAKMELEQPYYQQ